MIHTHATFYRGSAGPLADGTRYHAAGHFCAARFLPLGTVVRVRARDGRTMLLTVRDRAGRAGLDLPSRTFARLAGPGWRKRGRIPVRFEIVRRAKRRHRHHRSNA